MKRRDFIVNSLVISSRLAVPASAAILSACGGPAATKARFSAPTMGTVYDISLVDESIDDGRIAEIRQGMEAILADVIAGMSTYEEDSALSRFNASGETGWQSAPADLVEVLEEALAISRWSGGAFDATVGPLVDLWGFGPAGARPVAPTEAQVARAAGSVGYDRVRVDTARPALRKDNGAVRVDLSAIAKGFAADRMGAYLDQQGIRNYLIDIGGELRAGGRNDRDTAWRVAIERPEPGGRTVQRVVKLSDQAIATSGDYRNFFESNGRRYSHTIDPRSGRPVDHRLASVTVVHPRTMTADATATALLVLGPEKGFELAQRAGVAAHFMAREETGLVEHATRAMQAYLEAS